MATTGAAAAEPAIARSALRFVVTGHVQAVGFRPFVYRLATELGLAGWVRNRTGSVEIFAAAPTPRSRNSNAISCMRRRRSRTALTLREPVLDSAHLATATDSKS